MKWCLKKKKQKDKEKLLNYQNNQSIILLYLLFFVRKVWNLLGNKILYIKEKKGGKIDVETLWSCLTSWTKNQSWPLPTSQMPPWHPPSTSRWSIEQKRSQVNSKVVQILIFFENYVYLWKTTSNCFKRKRRRTVTELSRKLRVCLLWQLEKDLIRSKMRNSLYVMKIHDTFLRYTINFSD